ncbi:MAG TPA: class I SAM-dependent methyltransferase [Candidatus Woesebacteria bacterium]|nr:class I SAM-dependent methyltransferase [Candidatus Woesebacteria bacterium]
MKKIACPICNSKKIGKKINLYFKCKKCSSLYLIDPPSLQYIDKMVQKFGVSVAAESSNPKIANVFAKRVQHLSHYINPKSKILDVGCGNGFFVYEAKQAGYDVEAMDKAKACVEKMKMKGIIAYSNLSKVPNNHYDAITMFDVIEHIPDPIQFIDLIYKKLKRNGVVMITTPNIEGITSKFVPTILTTSGDQAFSEHFILFTPNSLELLLEEKFKILDTTTDTLLVWFYTGNSLFNKIVNKLIYSLLSPFFSNLFSRKYGDNIQIIATKFN